MLNMRNILFFLLIVATASIQISCGGDSASSATLNTTSTAAGANISGQIQGASNLQAFLDKQGISATRVIAKSEVDANGNFTLPIPDGLEAGQYRFRIGAKRLGLVFDGNEKNITINGNLADLDKYNITLEGSSAGQELVDIMKGLNSGSLTKAALGSKLKSIANPYTALMLANSVFRGASTENLEIHKSVLGKLQSAGVDKSIMGEYGGYIGQLEKTLSLQRIAVGKQAPDISLPSPDGKNFALSDLKGKVVLLDFWASWCGPCRRENPSVVKVYNQYKSKGFEVFSVSLDGLDSRTMARYGGNQAQIDQQMESSKNRWKQAIAQDKLSWNTHVSDLKKWDSAPAQTYGVSGIPRTFMIDREGNIAAVGLRGAASIEAELKKLL